MCDHRKVASQGVYINTRSKKCCKAVSLQFLLMDKPRLDIYASLQGYDCEIKQLISWQFGYISQSKFVYMSHEWYLSKLQRY